MFLGIRFSFADQTVKMVQTEYVDKILDKFGMKDCNPRKTPCDLGIDKISQVDSKQFEDTTVYREIIGSLIYLTTCTRPDISFIVNKLAQSMSRPTNADFNSAKSVLRYLKGTRTQGLIYDGRESECDLIGFADSDWGGSPDRRSISGYIFRVGSNDSPIAWRSKKQETVALSTCEAEYVSLTHAIQEAKFLSQLRADLYGSKFLV